MRRSHSKGALFNDEVFEVPILRSPARKNVYRAPTIGVQGVVGSEARAIPVLHHSREVSVVDKLLGRHFVFNITSTHTFESLKTRIQSRQGQEGLRIIPAHIQCLTYKGVECPDTDEVWAVVGKSHFDGALLELEPRVNELVSFFLASVSNLSGASGRSPKPEVQLSPTTSCADACFGQPVSHLSLDNDTTDFFGEPMEGVGDEITRTPSTPSSPRSVSSPPAPLSPVMSFGNASFASPKAPHFFLDDVKRRPDLRVDVGRGSPDRDLSAKATPNMCEQIFSNDMEMAGSPFHCGSYTRAPSSFEGISCIEQALINGCRTQAASSLYSSSLATIGERMDATLLREVDKGNYSSQSHIIFRDRTSCLLQLPEDKLRAMEQLVLQIQSGLRHGHAPEELSTSNRDSSRSISLTDSWERERAEWWQQHLLSPQGVVNGNLTDFDYGELVQNCCGGTYMMRDSRGAQAAVFKPIDEEPFAPYNPKGFVGMMDVESEMKAGIAVGGGAARECAAFLLDHDGLGAVPCTAMLRIAHTTLLADSEAEVQIKMGSLQRFQQHDCTAEDVGTAGFNLTQLHAIGVLDVRTVNMDRNSDNVLVKMASTNSGAVQLVPIDHGYILPSFKHLEEVHTCWLHWPQAKTPYSAEMLEYIESLDAEADMQLLRSTLALPEDCLLTLFIGTTLIKAAAASGLTLHETAMLMVRERSDKLSAVEHVVAEAVFHAESEGLDGGSMHGDFYEVVKRELRELLWQLVLAHQID